jgi:hypothetical protein
MMNLSAFKFLAPRLGDKTAAQWIVVALRAVIASAGVLAVNLSASEAARILYGFDSDQTAIRDWLPEDGTQNAVVLGSPSLSLTSAFGSKSLAFDGASFGALELPATTQLGSSFTLSAMVRETDGNFSRLFTSYDGGTPAADELVFDVNPSATNGSFGVRTIINGTSVTRSVNFADASYHHVALTYDHGDVRLFLDGSQLGAAQSVPGGAIALTRNLRFGEDYPPTSQTNELFKGLADDVLVYDRALSNNEISSLHQQGVAVAFGIRPPQAAEPLELKSSIEMFVDRRLLETSSGVALKLHPPEKREIALQLNMLYELSTATYFTSLRDEDDRIRLYYRGTAGGREATNVAISDDGVVFERPAVHIYAHDGSDANSIVWEGPQSHNLAPFLDPNPNAALDAKWKAIGGQGQGSLYALKSADGYHWELMQETPLALPGYFDSQNISFWDENIELYRSYSRDWKNGVRIVQTSISGDFIHWSTPQALDYDVPLEQFYTNGIVQVPGAEGLYLGFPMRFDPTRTNMPSPGQTGVTDAVFMTSRDGVHWDRIFDDPWIEKGYDTTRSNMPAWGIIETAVDEWSMYATERYRLGTNRLRRLTLRPYGFASVRADDSPGWFETPPVTFTGDDLLLNFQTDAGGSIAIEIRDRFGVPIPGFTLAEAMAMSGNKLERQAMWISGRSLGELIGQEIRLYLELRDADLYAIQFGDAASPADFNLDGVVDGGDLAIWRAGFGADVTGAVNGDADADYDVDGADFLIWQREAATNALLADSATIPEPGSGVLLLASVLAWMAVNRRTDALNKSERAA